MSRDSITTRPSSLPTDDMARRGKAAGGKRAAPAAQPRFHTPFTELKKLARRLDASPAPRAPRTATTLVAPRGPARDTVPARVPGVADRELLLEAMRDVVPLAPETRRRVDGPAPAGPGVRRPLTDEAETMAALGDLVSGVGAFDISDTDEYVEGCVTGLDPRLIRRLRRGEFAVKAHLDLHRLTADEARGALDRFLHAAHRQGHRCVLVIHGRGRNSKDQVPVLKQRLKGWLGRTGLSRLVLGFTSARPCDGGAGAVYVLLRRRREPRAPFVVTEGAKR
jgi:DNA-nicking Smr family endonuclease